MVTHNSTTAQTPSASYDKGATITTAAPVEGVDKKHQPSASFGYVYVANSTGTADGSRGNGVEPETTQQADDTFPTTSSDAQPLDSDHKQHQYRQQQNDKNFRLCNWAQADEAGQKVLQCSSTPRIGRPEMGSGDSAEEAVEGKGEHSDGEGEQNSSKVSNVAKE
ncbi:hypothetical protein F5Y19DRAFT_367979 [Xylariaceae sp. FL1651]|nr:hypothetical protein F5Y19DRAFT_367979 [Xylariaceae sp. FL1651]